MKVEQPFTRFVDVAELKDKLSKKQDSVKKQEPAKPNQPLLPSDQDLLEKAFNSKNGAKIQRLYSGDCLDYASRSEGDQALCNHLAFWLNKDPGRIDAAFRASSLMRPKWDEIHFSNGQAYGLETISKAIDSTNETYKDFSRKRATTYEPESAKHINAWEKPISLKEATAPDLKPDLLPGILGEITSAVSLATETHLELSAGLMLSVLGTACQGKFTVQVKPGYIEPVNVWILVALDSANRKSSIHGKMTKPLSE